MATKSDIREITPELWQRLELTYNGQDADRNSCVFHPERPTYAIIAGVPTCRECYAKSHDAALAAPGRTNVATGFARKWLRCRTCGTIQFQDYQPHSLSSPIVWTMCGHGVGERDLGCDRISTTEARRAFLVAAGF